MIVSKDAPVTILRSVGPAVAQRLKKLGIETCQDLVFYFPFRYEDFSQITTIAAAQAGMTVTVVGQITLLNNRRSWKRRMMVTEALVTDETGSIKVLWFNQPYVTKVLAVGDTVYLSGKVTSDGYIPLLSSPVYEKGRSAGQTIHTGRLTPIYSTTVGLTQKQIRWFMSMALERLGKLEDWLPSDLVTKHHLTNLDWAVRQIHFPDTTDTAAQAIDRLKFDELFLFSLQFQLLKRALVQSPAPVLDFHEAEVKQLVSQLPFALTDDQRRATWQIIQDTGQSRPMNRLLEGDVGSGKTVVAMIAAYNAATNGYQVACMAPTELLAQQHYATMVKLLAGVQLDYDGQKRPVNVALITGTRQSINGSDATAAQVRRQISLGRIDIVIGTHALLQSTVTFARLGLVIIDEQHRFGVNQRQLLHHKIGESTLMPHFLSMTATPIPRSLALTLYGDLHVSTLRHVPKNRLPIQTRIVSNHDREECYKAIRQQVAAGRQIFIICPLVDPSDQLGVKAATEEYQRLRGEVFPELRLGLLHGKLKAAIKEVTMADFAGHKLDILVATSVIEVGIDVPNATVIVIEGAERFGLAQLHQFRGRVGRGTQQSYCFLIPTTDQPLALQRLNALVEAKDGFALAELDLRLRGPGDLLGNNQSGWPTFKIASLFDRAIVSEATSAATELLDADPTLQQHPLIRQRLEEMKISTHRE